MLSPYLHAKKIILRPQNLGGTVSSDTSPSHYGEKEEAQEDEEGCKKSEEDRAKGKESQGQGKEECQEDKEG